MTARKELSAEDMKDGFNKVRNHLNADQSITGETQKVNFAAVEVERNGKSIREQISDGRKYCVSGQ